MATVRNSDRQIARDGAYECPKTARTAITGSENVSITRHTDCPTVKASVRNGASLSTLHVLEAVFSTPPLRGKAIGTCVPVAFSLRTLAAAFALWNVHLDNLLRPFPHQRDSDSTSQSVQPDEGGPLSRYIIFTRSGAPYPVGVGS